MYDRTNHVVIDNKFIGSMYPPYIIAEMSGNHNGSLERALKIVEEAAHAGVHALKIQTYTADTMTLELESQDFLVSDSGSLWKGRTLYSLYQEAHTPWEWHEPIIKRARDLGLTLFSTPFDESAVNFLEDLDVPCYKIASFENTDLPLIRKIASTGKPMIISTGMATVAELDETVRCARSNGCKDVILLKCTSSYPADPQQSNIRTIPHLKKLFDCEVGLSDHTPGVGVAVASVALGATVIEKHFTLNRSEGGVDAAFSIEPGELKFLITETKQAWQALGEIFYGTTPVEEKSLIFRRSLYITEDLEAGSRLSLENVRAIRPGQGLAPKYLEMVVGRTVKIAVKRGTPLDWNLLR